MLKPEEREHARKALGREVTATELRVLEVLWSEHCSYKSSRRWFHLLKTDGEGVVLGMGEGAGLVDIGDNLLVGVAMESHNHPSQLDPYHGAASGVGETIRDLISQGCNAIGLMNCVRLGDLSKQRNAHILDNIVRGISEYGNGVGIPMIGGEIEFDSSYDGNCLVNVVCIGYVRRDRMVRSQADTPGHHLVILGSRTGRDGIGGASFASRVLSEAEEESSAAVQIGDPLSMKVLLDTLAEIAEEGLLSGLQDLGGGGLAAAAGELASAGGTGVEIHLERVPLREEDMEPWEILISESQERMLAVVSQENLERVRIICEKNDCAHAVIGQVSEDAHFTARFDDESLARLPIGLMVGGFPEPERVEGKLVSQTDSLEWYSEPSDYEVALMKLMSSLNICDRSWIYSQYDQHVQSRTAIDIGENAGVLELPNGRLLAFTSHCNSYWCLLDPQEGTANSAAGSLRNIVSMGAKPLFITDCLNFGSPENPESYAQFVEAMRGLGRFSHDFSIPIVAGNVSLYNEARTQQESKRTNPTPQIMLSGIFPRGFTPVRRGLVTPWANIYLMGETLPELNGSEYQRMTLGHVKGEPPKYRPNIEKNTMAAVLEAHQNGLIRACNNVGRGGILVSLMKMALSGQYGFKLNLDYIPGTVSSIGQRLFSETSARYLAEVTESNQNEFLEVCEKHGVPSCEMGLTVNERVADFGSFSIAMEEVEETWRSGIASFMN